MCWPVGELGEGAEGGWTGDFGVPGVPDAQSKEKGSAVMPARLLPLFQHPQRQNLEQMLRLFPSRSLHVLRNSGLVQRMK